MTDVQEQVSVPQGADALSNALAKLILDVVAAKKGGATGVALVSAIGVAAVSDLISAIGSMSSLPSEVEAEPLGVAEALSLAAFKVARQLSGK